MTSKEKIKKAWELVNSKYIETNDEIQLIRYAVRMGGIENEKIEKTEKTKYLFR
jgi:hypothetical protein